MCSGVRAHHLRARRSSPSSPLSRKRNADSGEITYGGLVVTRSKRSPGDRLEEAAGAELDVLGAVQHGVEGGEVRARARSGRSRRRGRCGARRGSPGRPSPVPMSSARSIGRRTVRCESVTTGRGRRRRGPAARNRRRAGGRRRSGSRRAARAGRAAAPRPRSPRARRAGRAAPSDERRQRLLGGIGGDRDVEHEQLDQRAERLVAGEAALSHRRRPATGSGARSRHRAPRARPRRRARPLAAPPAARRSPRGRPAEAGPIGRHSS